MKNLARLLSSIFICELTGILSTPFTITAIPTWYLKLNKPVFSPPNWVFGPVWTLLYFLMGISFFLIWRQGLKKKKVQQASYYFFGQLALNFLWSILFFGLRSPILGLIDIMFLLVLIALTMKHFYKLSPASFWLLVPYFLWVSFATILNATLAAIN